MSHMVEVLFPMNKLVLENNSAMGISPGHIHIVGNSRHNFYKKTKPT